MILKKTGVDRSYSVSQYIFKFNFRTIPVKNFRPRNFFISFVVTGTCWPLNELSAFSGNSSMKLFAYLFASLTVNSTIVSVRYSSTKSTGWGCLLFSPWALRSQQKQNFPDLCGPQYLHFPISNHHLTITISLSGTALTIMSLSAITYTYSFATNILTCLCKTMYTSSFTIADSSCVQVLALVLVVCQHHHRYHFQYY